MDLVPGLAGGALQWGGETRRPTAELLREAPPEDPAPERAAREARLAADPAVQEALRAVIDRYERRWIDGRLPALGGMTPRQAAGGAPSLRRRLEDLRVGMEPLEWGARAHGAQGLSAARLRALLHLPRGALPVAAYRWTLRMAPAG